MARDRFSKLEEEHGELRGSAREANDYTVRGRFIMFYSVVLGIHAVLVIFAFVYLGLSSTGITSFGLCVVSNGNTFFDYYAAALTVAVNVTLQAGENVGNYSCVMMQNEPRMFVVNVCISASLLVIALVCHLKLPHHHAVKPYMDSGVCALVYLMDMSSVFISAFPNDFGRVYAMPSLNGARVRGNLWCSVAAPRAFVRAATQRALLVVVCWCCRRRRHRRRCCCCWWWWW
jgi:hypothetical protein